MTQAERIVCKFGGVEALVKALEAVGDKRDATNIHRWLRSKLRGGRGGIVPSSAIRSVLMAARCEGIVLTAEDLDPRTIKIAGESC